MEDLDLDLIDELCSSFCTPCSSQDTNKKQQTSSAKSNRKRTSTESSAENATTKRICLTDMTNQPIIYECDELSTLDESAIQMLVRNRFIERIQLTVILV